MVVRNIYSLGREKPLKIYIWIPPSYDPIYKIEVTTSNGIVYDVTDIAIEGEYIDGVTETIGSFSFKIDNSTQAYTSVFNVYNQIKIYMDYGATATTLRFLGRIERVAKSDHNLVLTGKSMAIDFMGKNVTYSATNMARSTILTNIINKYFDPLSAYTTGAWLITTNLESDTGTMTVNYTDKPFFEVVEEICNAGSRDAYIDVSTPSDFHYFESGSRQNTTEAMIHGYNLISTGDFSPDASTLYNKVKVYGKTEDGIPVLATAEDSASQTTYKVKELKITDDNISTIAQAQARADYELSINKDPPIVGEVFGLLLPTIQPGQQIRISDPLNGLNPGYYTIQKYTHKFSNDEPPMTTLTVQKERSSIPRILKKRIKFESETTAGNNPYELDFSYIFDFSSNIGSHSSTWIYVNPSTGKGELRVSSGSSGTWLSPVVTISSNLVGIEPRIFGNNLAGVQLQISTDGGIIHTPIVYGVTTLPAGRKIQFKIILNSATTIITKVGFLYSL